MTERPVLLQIGTVPERMEERMGPDVTLRKLPDPPERDRFLAEHGPGIVAVATNGRDGLSAELMAALPDLKMVASYGVGYDPIDINAALARGIIVTHTPDVLTDDVADTAILLWLAVTRRLLAADDWVRSGRWLRQGRFAHTPTAQGRTVGILGLGRIGRAIATRAEAFGARILYHGRSKQDVPYGYCADLAEMAAQSDVLICATPGGAGTRHLVDGPVIEALGPDGILVNIARGSVVDEAALIRALGDGALGGAGLDVFETEPVLPEALAACPNVVLTPHYASGTVETRRAMGDLVCNNISQFLKDGTVLTPVPECQGQGPKG